MSLNPSGATGRSWNFSRPNDEGYSLELWGTVVSMQEVQAREFNMYGNQPGRPRFWPDGNPVMNIRIGFAQPDGSLVSVTFAKAGKKAQAGEKPSLHMQLFNLTNKNMSELMGKTLHMWTWPANPETGQQWGQGNPRLFGVEAVDGVTYNLNGDLPDDFKVPELYCNDAVQGGQPVPSNPQQMQQPPMYGNFYAAPTVQQQVPVQQQYPFNQQNPAQFVPQGMQPAAQPQPPAPQGPAAQPPAPVTQTLPPQQVSSPMPQGMDPAVAAAMQAVGAVNIQPVQSVGQPEADPTGGIYDDDIPFNGRR